MDFKELKETLLKVFIWFLVVTAIGAIIAVLVGEFGDFLGKVLVSTLSISAASICAMSCAAFIEKRQRQGWGLAGIALAAVTAVLIITGLWVEVGDTDYWKTTISLGVAAAALAHIFLLLLPDLDAQHRWTQQVSAIAITTLSVQIIGAVLAEIDEDVYYRLLAAVGIVVGLGTLIVPILMKLSKEGKRVADPWHYSREEVETLILERVEGDRFTDPAGRTYKVTRTDAEESGDGGTREGESEEVAT